MISIKNKKKIYTVVSNAKIVFAEATEPGGLKTIVSFDLDDFLNGADAAQVCAELSGYENALLVIPDFWVGAKSFLIASNKSSVVEQFVRRKLKVEAPDVPGVEDFFDYVKYLDEQGREGVQVYHLLEAVSTQLPRRLAQFGLRPGQVTTPGLLWESKLRRLVGEFDKESIFLVNLVGSECFFYFFHCGRYLFSRDISFSENMLLEDRLDAISFEINQSRFLFSQRAKTEITRIFLVSSGSRSVDINALSQKLGKGTESLAVEAWQDGSRSAEDLSALLYFNPRELSASGQFVNLAHRLVRKELEWKPVQTSGIAVGFFLLFLLAAQSLFLEWWPAQEWQQKYNSRQQVEQRQILQKFNSNLDQLVREAEKTFIDDIVFKLMESLPDDIRIDHLSVQLDQKQNIEIEGRVKSPDYNGFKSKLAELDRNLKDKFGATVAVNPTEMEVDIIEKTDASDYGKYHFKFMVFLP